MFLLHYVLPLIIFYFYRNKVMLFGLWLGNLVDMDHIFYRLIGKVDWFESACPRMWMECSWNFYPLHNAFFGIIFLLGSSLVFMKHKNLKLVGWISLGAFLNLLLDYIHLITSWGL